MDPAITRLFYAVLPDIVRWFFFGVAVILIAYINYRAERHRWERHLERFLPELAREQIVARDIEIERLKGALAAVEKENKNYRTRLKIIKKGAEGDI
jgi:hypothetical protein